VLVRRSQPLLEIPALELNARFGQLLLDVVEPELAAFLDRSLDSAVFEISIRTLWPSRRAMPANSSAGTRSSGVRGALFVIEATGT